MRAAVGLSQPQSPLPLYQAHQKFSSTPFRHGNPLSGPRAGQNFSSEQKFKRQHQPKSTSVSSIGPRSPQSWLLAKSSEQELI